MRKIRILLADPRHNTKGLHSSLVPVGIGYIGSYLKQQIQHIGVELKLSTVPDEIITLLEKWKPNIIGISNYIWNSALSNSICQYAKKINPNTLCILGGPEFPAGTGARTIKNTSENPTYDKCYKYLIDRPSVDYFAYCDGEVAFLEVTRKFIENNFSVKSMKDKDQPIKGFASVSKDKSELHVGKYIPRIGMEGSVKAHGRDVIPSPYTSGLLDKFLDGTFMPGFETARGCPFMCAFCDQGLDKSKVTTFSTRRLAEEMMYVGKKMSKITKGTKSIHIFDNNWGLFAKDEDLGDEILKVMKIYDWPQFIVTHTTKVNWERSIKISDKLKSRVEFGLSMQSLNWDTLKDIKRSNWTKQQYIDFTKKMHRRGKAVASEMIIPLPFETEETYFKGIKFLMDQNVRAATYTLMMLSGTELGRDAAIKKYGMKSKFRVLPKQFGEYCGEKIFEIEKICVATNSMSYKSYLNCRNYSFILQILGHEIFIPIYKLTQKLGINWYDFSRSVNEILKNKNFKGKFKDLYNEWAKETSNELFDSREDAIRFYSKPKNYKSLVNGDVGENLLGKYIAKGLLAYDDVLTTIFYVMRSKFSKNYNKELNLILNSSEKWLRNLYMIKEIFGNKQKVKRNNKYKLKIDFDFPGWLSKNHLPFNQFIRNSTYEFNYDFKKLNYLHNEINSIYGKGKKRDLSRYVIQHMQKGSDSLEKRFQKIG